MISNLIISTIIWALSLVAYSLIFEGKTFHLLNRFFLLMAIIIGATLPYTSMVSIHNPIASLDNVLVRAVFETNHWFIHSSPAIIQKTQQTTPYLTTIYIIGLLLTVALFLFRLYKIWQIRQNGITHKETHFTLVESSTVKSPFSFFNWIFVPQNTATDALILKHEFAHVKFRHSWDLLLIEIISILFWFIPIFYFFRKNLKAVHEYSADQFVLQETDKKQYGYFLLGHTSHENQPRLVSNFQSILKKRILMLFKPASNRYHSFLYPFTFIVILGLSGIMVTACESSEKLYEPITQNSANTNQSLPTQAEMDAFLNYAKTNWNLDKEGIERAKRDFILLKSTKYNGDIGPSGKVRFYIPELDGMYIRVEE